MVHPQTRRRVPLVCTLQQRGVGSVAQPIEHVLHLPQVYPKRQCPYQLAEDEEGGAEKGIGVRSCGTKWSPQCLKNLP